MREGELANNVKSYIETAPRFFSEVMTNYAGKYTYRDILSAWSDIREKNILKRDTEGRYLI